MSGVRKRYLGLGGEETMDRGQRGRRKRCLQPVDVDLESAVEHFFNFGDFCSTFGGARGGF